MTSDIHIESLDSRPLAVVRRRTSKPELGKVIPEACGLVWNVLRDQKITGAGRHVAVYLDGEIHLEIGVEMNGPFAGVGEVVASATPAGLVASAVHLGPYPSLGQTHEAIQQWCADHGHKLAGPSWEIYGHWLDAWINDPAQIRTDVFYLLDH